MEQLIENHDHAGLVDCMLTYITVENNQNENSSKETIVKRKLEKLKELLTKSVSTVTSKLVTANKEIIAIDSKEGVPLLVIDDIQFLEPRGRFKLTVTDTMFTLEGKQFSCAAPLASISHLACIPSNQTTKKEGEDLLAMKFSTPIKINNKDIYHVLCNMSKNAAVKNVTDANGNEGSESEILTVVLQRACSVNIVRPSKSTFVSIINQKSFIRCYKGTQEGAIYPLKNGIVFVKPLHFIPAEEIASLTAGRGGGSGNTRYIDLMIETADEKVIEFTNIEREELPAVQSFLNGYLEERKKLNKKQKSENQTIDLVDDNNNNSSNSNNNSSNNNNNNNMLNDDDDDDDEDDDDYDPDETDSDEVKENSDDDSNNNNSDEESDNSDEEDSPIKKSNNNNSQKNNANNNIKNNNKVIDITDDKVIDITDNKNNYNNKENRVINLIESKSPENIKREREDDNNNNNNNKIQKIITL